MSTIMTSQASPNPIPHFINDSVELPQQERENSLISIKHFLLGPSIPNPKAYSKGLKKRFTVLVSICAAIDSISTNIFYPSLPELPHDLNTSSTIANLAIALPTITTAIFPLYWSHASEKFGRRPVYLLSLAIYIVFTALSANASSIAILLAMRMVASGAGSAVTPTGAAIVADIWEVKDKGQAMSIYYVGILFGPTLGPILGGVLTQQWGWRATQWFTTVYGALCLLLVVFFLPETCQDKIERKKQGALKEVQKSSRLPAMGSTTCSAVLHPLRIIFLLKSPVIAITIYLASITFLVVKALQISFQKSYSSQPYNFSPIIIGLSFLPFSIGLIIGDLGGGKWSDLVMGKTAVKSNRYDEEGAIVNVPEDRIGLNAWVATLLFPIGLLWYGWSIDKGVLWIVPMLGQLFVGLSAGLIFTLVTTVLVELIPQRSAPLVALNSLARNIFAAVGTAIAEPLLSALGNGWMFLIAAGLTLVSAFVMIMMKQNGQRWREALTLMTMT